MLKRVCVSGWLAVAGILGLGAWRALERGQPCTDPAGLSAPAGEGPKEATIGRAAPEFALLGDDGRIYRLSELRGRRVLICFLCGCSRCVESGYAWEKLHRAAPWAAVLGISTATPARLRAFRKATGSTFPILADPGFQVVERYRSVECPRSWVVDEMGHAIYVSRPGEAPAEAAAELGRVLGGSASSVRAARRAGVEAGWREEKRG